MDPYEMLAAELAKAEVRQEETARKVAKQEVALHEVGSHGKVHRHMTILTFLCGTLATSLSAIAPWFVTATASGGMAVGMTVTWLTLNDQPQEWLDRRAARKYGPPHITERPEAGLSYKQIADDMAKHHQIDTIHQDTTQTAQSFTTREIGH